MVRTRVRALGSVVSDAHRRARPRLELVPPPRRGRAPRRHVHRRRPREGDAPARRRRRPPRQHPGPDRRPRDRRDPPPPPARRRAGRQRGRSPRRRARSAPRRTAASSSTGSRPRPASRSRSSTATRRRGSCSRRSAASVVLEPAPALCIDVGGGSVEIMIGDAAGLRWSTSVPLGVGRLTAECVHDDPPSKADRARLEERVRAGLDAARRRGAGPRAPARGRHERHAQRPRAHGGRDAVGRHDDAAEHERAARGAGRHRGAARAHHGGEDVGTAPPPGPGGAAPGRAPPRGLDAPRDRARAVRARRPDRERLGAAGGHRARLGPQPRPERLVGRPAGAAPGVGGRAWPGAATPTSPTRRTWPDSRCGSSTRPPSSTSSASATARCSSSRRCCTTSASTSPGRATTATPRTWWRTASSGASSPPRSPSSPRSCATTAAATRRPPEPRFAALGPEDRPRLRKLAALLRVADGLDRGRRGGVEDLDAFVGKDLVVLRLTATDDAELELWGARRRRELFEKVFSRELELVVGALGCTTDV